jgi:signal peptidase I
MSEEEINPSESSEKPLAEAAAQNTVPKKGSKKTSIWREILSYVEIFAVAFVIAYILTHFLIINCKVPTGSMLDTIQLNDRIIGSRLSYLNSSPERGDIVIFPFPDDESRIYIKRVLGLPGETIEVKSGRVYINGSDTPLEEPYLKEEYLVGSRDFGPYTIPEGCYFMLGDHRNNSADSRVWTNTCVQEDKIMGKALFIYYPFSDITWLDQDYDYTLETE